MRSTNLIALNDPHSAVAERYKIFRTNLNYMNVDQVDKVIMFTSSMTNEGKTTSIANTAITFATSGKKVLLVDCDLRKSSLHKMFNLAQMPGLVNLLVEKLNLIDVVQKIEEFDNLDIITSGPQPPNPAEILATQTFDRMITEAREKYDIILIDSPPVLSIADASVLCRTVDGVVLIIALNETKKDDAKMAKKALEKVGAKILGTLICKSDIKKHHYYYYGNK
ncbi:CpsD/CapB family tyrosine-protein kinase [Dehalobacterium formicoaceticum]|uniref:non-specific protein-tyrosine kinase n=1 Tax=Dehalobacterium formicoaceticum TaxID=51515 RepID=A0ABT1Y7J1_9FIRM|nr:CpsD/CapB family tyrosine-protein kinase [Dehalobacterium formicoaceticum]MCR6546859.1 CpsD/CapB family tyrosine-protein kinase [Dehalobacterium formicoaceticum]